MYPPDPLYFYCWIFFIVDFFFHFYTRTLTRDNNVRNEAALLLVPSYYIIRIIKYNKFMYTYLYVYYIVVRARSHACVCVCSRRQDSGGAANVGALCRLVNARRDVTSHARLTKWTSFAKSALLPVPPKYIFPRPFRTTIISCRTVFHYFVLYFFTPIPRRCSAAAELL